MIRPSQAQILGAAEKVIGRHAEQDSRPRII
jgi:hypothetical protein